MILTRAFFVVFWILGLAVGVQAEPLKVGERIPPLSLTVPEDSAARDVLGVQGKTSFGLADLQGDVIFLEVVGVYCAHCVKQSPGFKTLVSRLNKGKLKGRVAMLALAAGATEREVRLLVASGQYHFPVISDPEYTAHKLLGEPLTPYTMVCRPDGTILYAHLGVVEDIDGLYKQIKEFLD